MAPTRRDFLESTAVAAVATAAAAGMTRALAQDGAFPDARTVRTAVLDIGYEEHGDPAGTAVILLHGFPYDVRCFDRVVAPLVAAGHRVLVPWLRGYGPTRFLDSAAPRMAEQAAIGQDVIDFADALRLERFATAGFDWGNRAACIASVLQPERVIGQVSIGGNSIQDTLNPGAPMPARLASQFWYMWYFNTEAGRIALEADRHDIVRYLWQTWSPEWIFTDADYARSASSFDNPDFVDIVIHSYRHRQRNAPGEERFLELERRLAAAPTIDVPAIVLRAGGPGLGGPASPDPAADRARFTKLVDRRIVEGAGHNLPAQRPDAVADALLELVG